jgi:pantoate--beta-alanine ligase
MTSVIQRIAEWKDISAGLRRGDVAGLVPTMGALHDGHGALFDEARRRCSIVVASVFINPIQFNKKSDYDLYPRMLEEDLAFCESRGVNYVFAPTSDEMYPAPQQICVEVDGLAQYLCGKGRPGHFRGVATVVLKLFQIVQPRLAFFGEKDYQQLAIVRRLTRDLNVPVDVVGIPTVREPDGLAMSSRNRHLSSRERSLAPLLYRALSSTRKAIARGGRNAAVIRAHAIRILEGFPEIEVEYFELIDPETIRPVEFVDAPVRAVSAVWVGTTRLIDNALCEPPQFQNRQQS